MRYALDIHSDFTNSYDFASNKIASKLNDMGVKLCYRNMDITIYNKDKI